MLAILLIPLPLHPKETQLEGIRSLIGYPILPQETLSNAEKEIIRLESGGNPLAKNPYSSASGVFQLLDANKVYYGHKLGIDPYTSNKELQIEMGRAYITDRYGTAEKALKFHTAHGFY